MKDEWINNPLATATPEEMVRLAINPDLTTDIYHPRNVRYLFPFLDSGREEMSHAMADVSYSAAADEFHHSTTQAEADQVYEQCLVDARRILCDPDYARLFGGEGDIDREQTH